MKVYIDPVHGLHYHKKGCRLAEGYTSISLVGNRALRIKNKLVIMVNKRAYIACPYCFGNIPWHPLGVMAK